MAVITDIQLPAHNTFQNQAGMALTTGYKQVLFGFKSSSIQIVNDAATAITFSFDGVTAHGIVLANSTLTLQWIRRPQIYLKGASGGEAYRLFVW